VRLFVLMAEMIDHKAFGIQFMSDQIKTTDPHAPEISTKNGKLYKLKTLRRQLARSSATKSPQALARKYLETPLKRLYRLLFLCCQNNEEISGFLLKKTVFLSGQLALHTQEVRDLLKEVIFNSRQSIHIDKASQNVLSQYLII
jgi:hypothetical protein